MAAGYKITEWNDKKIVTLATEANMRAMEKAAVLVEREVKTSFGKGASRADVSQRRTMSGKRHRPSAPGFPPNIDTGTLKNSIGHTVLRAGDVIDGFIASSGVKYALPLELGTKKNMQPRPFLRPALKKNRAKIERLFKEASS